MDRISEASVSMITCPVCKWAYSKSRLKRHVCNPEKASRKLQRLAQQGDRPVMLLHVVLFCQAITRLKYGVLVAGPSGMNGPTPGVEDEPGAIAQNVFAW